MDTEDNHSDEEYRFENGCGQDDYEEGEEGFEDSFDENDVDDVDEDDDDDLFDLSYEELAEVLPGGADEAHEYVTRMAARTLALLYKVREEDPEADVDGRNINEFIAELEGVMARAEASDRELRALAQKQIDCYAEMCLQKASFPSPFWSFAATLGRFQYPAHPKLQAYFDIEDLRAYLERQAPNPLHLLN